jgi:hypothetical protein
MPSSRVLRGKILAEGDSHTFTEAVWNIRRRRAEGSYPKDVYSGPEYVRITNSDETVDEGMGIIVDRREDCAWLPENHIVLAIVAPVKNGAYTGEVVCL